jgi:eukaryotic-like serine/threonine-protein kinase
MSGPASEDDAVGPTLPDGRTHVPTGANVATVSLPGTPVAAGSGGATPPLPATDDPGGVRWRTVEPGITLGRYEIAEEIGAGGMATVFRARDRELRRDVAVKVLFPQLARRREVVARFQREARAAAGLEHPNILRVYDVGGGATPSERGGVVVDPPYIVMELVRGGSLRELGETQGAMLGELVAAIGVVLCRALGAAHKAGIIHRDIKPANVLCAAAAGGERGKLALADFGVAHLDDDDSSLVTRTGALLGTPAFMSPEQAQGMPVDARSDLYSLGATLYQLATGSAPYTGSTARVVAAIARGELVSPERRNPALGGALSRAIERLMAVEVEARFATAEAAEAALAGIVRDGGLGTAEEEVAGLLGDPAGHQVARRPVVVAATLAAAERAAAARAVPRALGLAGRVLALDPANGQAQALVDRIGRGRRRGRLLGALGGAGALAAIAAALVIWWPGADRAAIAAVDGGAELAGMASLSGESDEAAEASASQIALVAAADAGAIAAADPAADPAQALAPAAGREAGKRPAAKGQGARKADQEIQAGQALPGAPGETELSGTPDDSAAPPDVAPAATPDAGVAEPARPAASPAAPARVTLAMDAWCDVTIDGVAHGRNDPRRPIELPAGRHEIACSQGRGLGGWSTTVTLAAGQSRKLTGSLLRRVRVTVSLSSGDAVSIGSTRIADGASAELAPQRYRVVVLSGSRTVKTAWVTLPRDTPCTLRDLPDLDCYR